VSYLLAFVTNFVDAPWQARQSTSGTSSLSSGDSVVPMSVKQSRPKRTMSDEDVWNYPDSKIIGTNADQFVSRSSQILSQI